MFWHILYISEKTNLFKDDLDLEHILEISQRNNNKNELTGMLIKNGNFFIQLLEGKKEQVMATYNVILSDPRHRKLRILLSYQDKTRLFPEWAMGLIENEENAMNINELIPLLHTDIIKLKSEREKVISILKNFNKKL